MVTRKKEKCIYCGKTPGIKQKVGYEECFFCLNCYESNGIGKLENVNPLPLIPLVIAGAPAVATAVTPHIEALSKKFAKGKKGKGKKYAQNIAIKGKAKFPYATGIIPREVEKVYPYSDIYKSMVKQYGEERGRGIFYSWLRGISPEAGIRLPPVTPAGMIKNPIKPLSHYRRFWDDMDYGERLDLLDAASYKTVSFGRLVPYKWDKQRNAAKVKIGRTIDRMLMYGRNPKEWKPLYPSIRAYHLAQLGLSDKHIIGVLVKKFKLSKSKAEKIVRAIRPFENSQTPTQVWKQSSPAERLSLLRHAKVPEIRHPAYMEKSFEQIPERSQEKVKRYIEKYRIATYGKNVTYFKRPERPGYPINGRRKKTKKNPFVRGFHQKYGRDEFIKQIRAKGAKILSQFEGDDPKYGYLYYIEWEETKPKRREQMQKQLEQWEIVNPYQIGDKVKYYNIITNRWSTRYITEIKGKKIGLSKVKGGGTDVYAYPSDIKYQSSAQTSNPQSEKEIVERVEDMLNIVEKEILWGDIRKARADFEYADGLDSALTPKERKKYPNLFRKFLDLENKLLEAEAHQSSAQNSYNPKRKEEIYRMIKSRLDTAINVWKGGLVGEAEKIRKEAIGLYDSLTPTEEIEWNKLYESYDIILLKPVEHWTDELIKRAKELERSKQNMEQNGNPKKEIVIKYRVIPFPERDPRGLIFDTKEDAREWMRLAGADLPIKEEKGIITTGYQRAGFATSRRVKVWKPLEESKQDLHERTTIQEAWDMLNEENRSKLLAEAGYNTAYTDLYKGMDWFVLPVEVQDKLKGIVLNSIVPGDVYRKEGEEYTVFGRLPSGAWLVWGIPKEGSRYATIMPQEELETMEKIAPSGKSNSKFQLPVPFHKSSRKSYCTEASLQSLLDYYTIDRTQDEINKEVPYFEHENLIPYLEKTTGKKFEKIKSLDTLEMIGFLVTGIPLIVRVEGKHTVLVVGYDNDGYTVYDPDVGVQYYTFDKMLNKMTGVVYQVEDDSQDGIAELIKGFMQKKGRETAVDYKTNVADWIKRCVGDDGIPIIKTEYKEEPYGKGLILGTCWAGSGAVEGSWFENVPKEDIGNMEAATGDWKWIWDKYGTPGETLELTPTAQHEWALERIPKLAKQNGVNEPIRIPVPYYPSERSQTEAVLQSLFEYYGKNMTQNKIHEKKGQIDILDFMDNEIGKNFVEVEKVDAKKLEKLIESNIPVMLRLDNKDTIAVIGQTINNFIYHHPSIGSNIEKNKTELTENITSAIYEIRINELTENSARNLLEVAQ